MNQTLLHVKGMSCGHCVDSVESALKRIGAKGTVDLEAGTVQVIYDENRLTLEQVKETIEDQGYDVV
ncbi:copper chaperone [Kroppenstedtia sanguinis]|uniref:Cation transporter n=1 Tax=Kroppenstedtia sanguinis TaxID=1380684 RepID=A0ABW4C733_9BACL|nr:heavy-metal-associated domain-containing protein [Alteromonadaceae bacterium]